jgi:hypothetical protein
MKKGLLAVAVALSTVTFGQNIDTTPRNLEVAPAKTAIAVQNRSAKKKAQIAVDKTNGGPLSQWMSHYDPVIDLYGSGTGSPLQLYIDPMFVDSTVTEDFGTPRSVGTHGVGAIFDPSSTVFTLLNQDYLSDADPYTLDSIAVQGVYDIVTSGLSGATGDKLRFEIVWDDPLTTTDDAFDSGVQYNPNTFNNQPDALPLLGLKYTGDAADGDKGSLDGSNVISFEYSFMTGDSASTIVIVPVNGGSGQMIPAGAVVGVSVKFIPGYNWTPGDMYFSGTGGGSSPVINNYRALLFGSASATDNEGYFMEKISYDENSWAYSQALAKLTRYNAYAGNLAFLNELYLPGNRSYLMDFHITAVSSISIEENLASNVNVYPNPSNGQVKVNFGELSSGTYNVRLVNIIGQDVFNQDVEISTGTVEVFNFESLDKGVYLMNITGNGLNTVRKVTLR